MKKHLKDNEKRTEFDGLIKGVLVWNDYSYQKQCLNYSKEKDDHYILINKIINVQKRQKQNRTKPTTKKKHGEIAVRKVVRKDSWPPPSTIKCHP